MSGTPDSAGFPNGCAGVRAEQHIQRLNEKLIGTTKEILTTSIKLDNACLDETRRWYARVHRHGRARWHGHGETGTGTGGRARGHGGTGTVSRARAHG